MQPSRVTAFLLLGVLAGCAATSVDVSGRVVIEGSNAPLANHEIEVLVTSPPWIPLGTPSYVKRAVARTDVNGFFSFAVKIPKHRRFALQTTNNDNLPGSFLKLSPDESTQNLKLIHSLN
jgi:hypothetical protein